MYIIDYLELVGVAAFAISGATTAIKKKMDLFGVIFLATVTAIGGGVIRDVVMNIGVPVFFTRYEYIAVVLGASIFVVLFKGCIKWKKAFFLFDAIGLAVFSIYTGEKALELHYNFLSFIFVCLITGVGGGMLRDVLVREIPMVLKKEIYATASIIGVVVLWLCEPLIGMDISIYVAISIIILIRVISKWLKINLPFVKETDTDKADDSAYTKHTPI